MDSFSTVIVVFLLLVGLFSVFVLPFLLARRGWSSLAIGYTVGTIFTIVPTLVSPNGQGGILFRGPTVAAIVLGIPINGAIFSGVIALVRKIWSMVTR